jgi:hypothetical protein
VFGRPGAGCPAGDHALTWRYLWLMFAEGADREGERARRRAARTVIAAYHDEQLRVLLEHVREGFARMDGGEIDPFELDELIHHYKKAAAELWKFCGTRGSDWERAARTLEILHQDGEPPPDWWAAAEKRRRGG